MSRKRRGSGYIKEDRTRREGGREKGGRIDKQGGQGNRERYSDKLRQIDRRTEMTKDCATGRAMARRQKGKEGGKERQARWIRG